MRVFGSFFLAWGASGIALSIAGAAYAQKASADNGNAIPEIIVTAQKREQRLQDVPIAVTAVTGGTLETNRVQNVTDLTGLSPGLLARNSAGALGAPVIAMRGVSSTAGTASQDREISQYLDGVYIGGSRAAIFNIPDTERIEVLRGPQGTLFGRNSTAGAISIVTRDPLGHFGFRQELTVGNEDQIRTRTSVDSPQMGAFSAYVTYVHDEMRGGTRNLGAGTTFCRNSPFPTSDLGCHASPKWLGGHNIENVFAAIRFAPSTDFRMTYKFDNSDGTSVADARAVTVLDNDPNDQAAQFLRAILAAQPAGGGIYGPVPLNPGDRRPDAVNNAWTELGYLHAQGHNLTTEWRATDHLTIKNISAYRWARVYGPASIAGFDGLDFAPYSALATLGAAYFQLPPAQRAAIVGQFRQGLLAAGVGDYFGAYESSGYGYGKQVSSELQANYTSHLIDVTAGALYYHAKEVDGGLPGFSPNFAFTPIPQQLPLGNVANSRATTTSIAAYTQADIHLTHQLDLQVGGRVTHDRKITSLEQGGTYDAATQTITGIATVPGNFSVTRPTWSVNLSYKPVRDTLLYVKASTGFLSGGAIGTLTFKPENTLSFEGGVKTDLFDHHLRINLAVWDARYKHNQSAQNGATVGHPELGVVVVDAGTLQAHGAELELFASPFDGLTLGGQVGYTRVKQKDLNPILLTGLPGQTRYDPANIPTWTANANAQYVTHPLFAQATVMFRIDANYQGRSLAITDPDIARDVPAFVPYRYGKARWIMNGRLALRDFAVARAKGEIALWVRNLTNNGDSLFPFPFSNYLFTNSYQPPRTYGVDFIVHY